MPPVDLAAKAAELSADENVWLRQQIDVAWPFDERPEHRCDRCHRWSTGPFSCGCTT
jgi:hypothetical protein